MSRPNPTAVHRVWEALQERERARAYFSRLSVEGGRYPSPESVFYSTRDSRSERERNRYSDVLAYDRTAVRVEGRYLNASVVLDNIGNWWVAAQVCILSEGADVRHRCRILSTTSSEVSLCDLRVSLAYFPEENQV